MDRQQIECAVKALDEFIQTGMQKMPGVEPGRRTTFLRLDNNAEGPVKQACFIAFAAVGVGAFPVPSKDSPVWDEIAGERDPQTGICCDVVLRELAAVCLKSTNDALERYVDEQRLRDALDAGIEANDCSITSSLSAAKAAFKDRLSDSECS